MAGGSHQLSGNPRAFLPATARGPVQRTAPARAGRRAVPQLQREDRGRVLRPERRARQLRADQLRSRADARLAGWSGTTPRRTPRSWRRSAPTSSGTATATRLAQVYSHAIMPLATDHEKRIQVAWGIADFRHRFGHAPDGMWLAETAADSASLGVLLDHGIRYTVLAPWQAAEPIDPSEPYWVAPRGRPADRGVLLQRRPLRAGLVRLVADHERRRVRPQRPPAPRGPRALGARRVAGRS